MPVLDEEFIEEMDEVEEQQQGRYRFGRYYCMKGNHYTPFFLAKSDKATFVKCPVCGASVGKKRVPASSIIVDEELYEMIGVHPREIFKRAQEKGYLPDNVDIEELMDMINPESAESDSRPVARRQSEPRNDREEHVRHEEDEEKTPLTKLFDRPKTPCEVLREVLSQFNLKEAFVTAMVRRCERQGSLHPVELLHYLTAMKSGVKTQGEAQFIAEEYAAALRQEMEKAKQLNMPYPSIGITEPWMIQGSVGNPAVSRLLQLVPPGSGSYPTQQAPGSASWHTTRASPQARSPAAPVAAPAQDNLGAVLSAIAQLVQALSPRQSGNDAAVLQLLVKQQEQMMQLIMQQQQQQIQILAQQLGQGLQELGKSFSESLKELANMVKEVSNRQQVDPDLLYKVAKAEAEKEYLQKLLEQREKEHEQLVKHLSELEKKIYDVIMQTSKPAGDFQSDEAKLVAQALQQAAAVGSKLVDVLDKRQPIKVIIEALPTILQAQPVAGKYRAPETSQETIFEELERIGLVEEEVETNA